MCDEGEDLLGGVGPSGELGEACGEEVVAFGGSSELVARRVAEEAVLALLEGESGELSAVGSAGGLCGFRGLGGGLGCGARGGEGVDGARVFDDLISRNPG